MKIYKCNICGNIITYLDDKGVVPVCCNEQMHELVPKNKDELQEKHVPVVETKDNVVTVKIGEVAHPMSNEHYIEWIILETDKAKYIRTLKPGCEPIASFVLHDEKPIKVYAYCNIHSLWSN